MNNDSAFAKYYARYEGLEVEDNADSDVMVDPPEDDGVVLIGEIAYRRQEIRDGANGQVLMVRISLAETEPG